MTSAPANLESERSVLGALMIDTRRLPDVAEDLTPDAFFSRHHGTIYRAILDLFDADDPVDVVTVSEKLDRQGRLDEVGGLAYLGELAKQVHSTANVESYAQAVKDRHLDRRLVCAADEIRAIASEALPVAQKLERSGEILSALVTHTNRGDLLEARDLVSDVLDRIEARAENQGGLSGISTGFIDLDRRLDGLNPGELIVIAGRPSMGKTAFAMNIASHVAREAQVAVFELEMPRESLVTRLISALGQVRNQDLRRGSLDEDAWSKVVESTVQIGKLSLAIDDTPGQSLSNIRAACRKLHRRKPVGLVVVDYVQIMDVGDRDETRSAAIGRVTGGLKNLAKELGCPVLLLSQLNREVDKRTNKRPQLSDLRDSGALEQDADVILFLYRESAYDPDADNKSLAECICAKHRNGEIGTDYLVFQGQYTRFLSTRKEMPE